MESMGSQGVLEMVFILIFPSSWALRKSIRSLTCARINRGGRECDWACLFFYQHADLPDVRPSLTIFVDDICSSMLMVSKMVVLLFFSWNRGSHRVANALLR